MSGAMRVVAWAIVLAAVSTGWARPKYADWARTQATGAAIPSATIRVVNAGTTTLATIYQANGQALANPFQANATGYYEFFSNPAAYDVHVLDQSGSTELYVIPGVLLVDAAGPVRVCSTVASPALTTVQIGPDQPGSIPISSNTDWAQLSTTSFRFERRTSTDTLDGKPWFLVGYRAEQGIDYEYNRFGRYGLLPIVPGPVGEVFDSNTADEGNFHLADFNIDWHGGGLLMTGDFGLWVMSGAGSAINVDMGIDGTMPNVNDVVVVSTAVPGSVTRTTRAGAQAPLVVTALQNGRALVAVGGIATVKAKGPIAVGDVLKTSNIAGFATKASSGGAPITLGSALTALKSGSGTVKVRIGMVKSS